MKQLLRLSFIIFSHLLSAAAADSTEFQFSDANQRLNYTLGHIIALQIISKKLPLEESVILKGLNDSLTKNTPLLSKENMEILSADLRNELQRSLGLETVSRPVKSRHEIYMQRQHSGTAFMQANQHRSNIVTLPSGVQYKVKSNGTGNPPQANDTIMIEFQARTVDGKMITRSGDKGEPASFRVNELVKGFAEAIQLMQPGAEWEIYIPPHLAYGHIRRFAHQTLIVEAKLISVN